MSEVWLPLFGPNDKGHNPKGVSVSGWQLPEFKGVLPEAGDWIGLRLDDWIVVDCDDEAALEAWLKHVDKPLRHTFVRKTPHGWHLFYRRTYQSLSVRAQVLRSVSPKIDLKLGVGHQVVFFAPGYETIEGTGGATAMPFDPAWVPAESGEAWAGDEWSEMPEGIGDNSMIAFGGSFRRWGMDEATIRKCLQAINEITMTENPMPPKSIRRLARQAAKYHPEEARTVMCPSCAAEVEYR